VIKPVINSKMTGYIARVLSLAHFEMVLQVFF
jgi:hypothetical protein